MPSPVILTITETQRQLARHLAQDRTKIHDKTRKPEADIGDPNKQAYLEYHGVLGEIILIEAIERDCLLRGKPFNVQFKLWLDCQCPDPDLILPTMRIDIKSLPPKYRFLNINASKVDGPDAPDYFIVVAFDNDQTARILYPIRRAAVRKWPRLTFRTDLYGVDITKVQLEPYTGELWRLANPDPPTKSLPIIPDAVTTPSTLVALQN